MKRKKLYLIVEGGVLQDVCTDDADAFQNVDVILIDYDTEGLGDGETQRVLDADGKAERALVKHIEVTSPMLIKPPSVAG